MSHEPPKFRPLPDDEVMIHGWNTPDGETVSPRALHDQLAQIARLLVDIRTCLRSRMSVEVVNHGFASSKVSDQDRSWVAFKRWADGGESVEEYFTTAEEAKGWISKQPGPIDREFAWHIGRFS